MIGNRRVPGQYEVCRGFPSVDDLRKGSTSTICSMRTPRRRLSPDDRRAELLALGAEVFGQRPYDEVRIDEIAERAGVSRALMYHYFPDKRAFFAAVVKGQADQLFETTNTPADARSEPLRRGARRCTCLHAVPPGAPARRVGGICRTRPLRSGLTRHRRRGQGPPDGTHHEPRHGGRRIGQSARSRSSNATCGSSSTVGWR